MQLGQNRGTCNQLALCMYRYRHTVTYQEARGHIPGNVSMLGDLASSDHHRVHLGKEGFTVTRQHNLGSHL